MGWEIVAALAGVLSMFAAWLTIFEKRKAKRIKEYEKRREETKETEKLKDKVMLSDFKDEIIFSLNEILDKKLKGYLQLELYNEKNDKLWNKLNAISDELKTHFDDTIESEVDRIGHEIMNYADALRAGETRYRDSYKYICAQFDKYKRLGGNNYIDQQMIYIRDKMKDVVE